MKSWIKGMRDSFFDSLYKVAENNPDVILVTSDTGAICHDDFKKNLPEQYINVGIAEQNMIGIAAGLALQKKIVYCYAIIPFATMRCFEQIRVNISCMNLPVNIVGIGSGFDYSTLGPTHHGTEDLSLMRILPNFSVFIPSDSRMAAIIAESSAREKHPKYIRLDRTGEPAIYTKTAPKISRGYEVLKNGSDLLMIAAGRMVHTALNVCKKLRKSDIHPKIIDLFRIKPLNRKALIQEISGYDKIVTVEEHFRSGGLGSTILEFISDEDLEAKVLRIGIDDKFCRVYGERAYLQQYNDLDADSITDTISTWLNK